MSPNFIKKTPRVNSVAEGVLDREKIALAITNFSRWKAQEGGEFLDEAARNGHHVAMAVVTMRLIREDVYEAKKWLDAYYPLRWSRDDLMVLKKKDVFSLTGSSKYELQRDFNTLDGLLAVVRVATGDKSENVEAELNKTSDRGGFIPFALRIVLAERDGGSKASAKALSDLGAWGSAPLVAAAMQFYEFEIKYSQGWYLELLIDAIKILRRTVPPSIAGNFV